MPPARPQAILIVGGGQGVGLATIQNILELSTTARIVVLDLRFDPVIPELMRAHAKRLLVVQGDVRAAEDRERAVALCEHKLGGIDTLVYAASTLAPIERIERMDLDAVRDAFEINVFGCMAMVQLSLSALRTSRINHPLNPAHGKILILTSPCASSTTYHGWTPYCTSQAALTRFVSTLAHEERLLAVQGICVGLFARSRTVEGVIKGRYEGVMATHEVERFRAGGEVTEGDDECGMGLAKVVVGLVEEYEARSRSARWWEEDGVRREGGSVGLRNGWS